MKDKDDDDPLVTVAMSGCFVDTRDDPLVTVTERWLRIPRERESRCFFEVRSKLFFQKSLKMKLQILHLTRQCLSNYKLQILITFNRTMSIQIYERFPII